jgi:hypothetical protein
MGNCFCVEEDKRKKCKKRPCGNTEKGVRHHLRQHPSRAKNSHREDLLNTPTQHPMAHCDDQHARRLHGDSDNKGSGELTHEDHIDGDFSSALCRGEVLQPNSPTTREQHASTSSARPAAPLSLLTPTDVHFVHANSNRSAVANSSTASRSFTSVLEPEDLNNVRANSIESCGSAHRLGSCRDDVRHALFKDIAERTAKLHGVDLEDQREELQTE